MIKNMSIGIACALALLAISNGPAMAQGIQIESGSVEGGALETRNEPIRIGDEVSIKGPIGSRNGSITIGSQVIAESITNRNGSISVGQGGQFGDISTRNGSVHLGDANRTGKVESRNGQIRLGDENISGTLTSRNGSIVVGRGSQVDGNVDTRNGSVTLNDQVAVSGGISTRNGAIQLSPGSEVADMVSTRNGRIKLDNAVVAGDLRTRAGDLVLDNASRVGGDLVMDLGDLPESGGRFLWFSRSVNHPDAGRIHILGGSEVTGDVIVKLPETFEGKPPVVEIAADSTVHGNIEIDERVELVADGRVGGRIQRNP